MKKFILLFSIFFLLFSTSCIEEDFAPKVDDTNIYNSKYNDSNGNKLDENNPNDQKEISKTKCDKNTKLPMNCCTDLEQNCKYTECNFVLVDEQCVLSCDGVSVNISVNSTPNWTGIQNDNEFGLPPLPPPTDPPIPGSPPNNPDGPPHPYPSTPISCSPW
ncbi:MAG: hypothetical protein L3J07_00190 [Candidatus Magasanikbacteria bacterium]|nr:hypothetical protein [Candidatus Magasanikbacteria bacterium]